MLKLLILSDLHTHAELISDTAPSYISNRDDSQDPTLNSLSGLLKFAQEQQLKANWIICPGDIAHQATPDTHSYAWAKLEEIKKTVGASDVFATIGNHDIDSRRARSDFDPKSMLQALAPPFPGLDQKECFQFWAENFYCKVDTKTDTTLLLVNSCAFHGLASKADDHKAFIVDEYLYGRISAPTLTQIRKRLSELARTTYNIVVVHHHVAPHPLLKKDVSLMRGNLEFLQELKNTDRRWLLIHGHLHLPALRYSDGDFLAPIVFSAGAAGATPYPVLGEITPRNQFYQVELHPPANIPGAQMRGIVHSWDWAPTQGWIPSRAASGLPHRSGFGARIDLPKLAQDIANDINQQQSKQKSWEELKTSFPDLAYLLAKECKDLVDLCDRQHNIEALEQSSTGNLQLLSVRRP